MNTYDDSIDSNDNPISLKQLRHSLDHAQVINWKESVPDLIFQSSFTYLYGVYSRHGRFYPPYNVIPDINYGEFIQNVF